MNDALQQTYRDCMDLGAVLSPRGERTRDLMNVQLTFSNEQWFIDHPVLPLSWDYVKTELKWYLKGDAYDLSICDHASIWKDCVDAQGKINSNYGQYFNAQMGHVVDILCRDVATRRAIININQLEHNYLENPDVPCTISLQFLIRNGGLHMIATMRSQDGVFGLRNDLPAFQMFKLFIAAMVGLTPGLLMINVGSWHIYERHWEKVREAIQAPEPIVAQGGGFHSWKEFTSWLKS